MRSSSFLTRAFFGLSLCLLLSAIAAKAENVTYKFSSSDGSFAGKGTRCELTVTLDRNVAPVEVNDSYVMWDGNAIVAAFAQMFDNTNKPIDRITYAPGLGFAVSGPFAIGGPFASVMLRYTSSGSEFEVAFRSDTSTMVIGHAILATPNLFGSRTTLPTGQLGPAAQWSGFFEFIDPPNDHGYDGETVNLQFLADTAPDEQQIAQLQAALDTANALVASLQAQLDAANACCRSLTDKLAQANATICSLRSQLAAANTANAGLVADKAALNTQLQSVLAQVGPLTAERDALLAQVATLQGSLSAAQSQVATVTSDLATAQAQNAVLQSTNATLAANLSAAQAQIATLQSQVATVTPISAVLGSAFGDPSFTIFGATPAQQIQTLAAAISSLNHGQQQALYKSLGGSK